MTFVSMFGTTSVLCADAHSHPVPTRCTTKEKMFARELGCSISPSGVWPDSSIRA
jgi:hypothetical protein